MQAKIPRRHRDRKALYINILCINFFTVMLFFLFSDAFAAVKPQYGGNLKVADEFLASLIRASLFTEIDGALRQLFPIPYSVQGNDLTLDFSSFDPDLFTEIENNVANLQKQDQACHWILDYPYLSHNHTTTIEARDNKVVVHADSMETLNAIAQSPCLIGPEISTFEGFAKTQFSYEANANCLAGRPYLDSVTPASVDPVNPYLSFKLNDADVIPIPEDRFQQISKDPDLQVMNGPKSFVFLRTNGISQEAAASIASAVSVSDIGRAVLNGHIEPLLNSEVSTNPRAAVHFRFTYPREAPYSLIGERIELQLREAGFDVNPSTNSAKLADVSLEVFPVSEPTDETTRYLLLQKYFPNENRNLAWFEVWDEYEASGRILPLFVHRTMLAVRKGVHDISAGADGFPDFSNAWLEAVP